MKTLTIKFVKPHAVTAPGKHPIIREVIEAGEVRTIPILAAESLIREGVAEKVD